MLDFMDDLSFTSINLYFNLECHYINIFDHLFCKYLWIFFMNLYKNEYLMVIITIFYVLYMNFN